MTLLGEKSDTAYVEQGNMLNHYVMGDSIEQGVCFVLVAPY